MVTYWFVNNAYQKIQLKSAYDTHIYCLWLAFFAMTALLVALPYFDSRLYSDLNQNEISSYQKKLVESIRNNRINGILAGVPVLPNLINSTLLAPVIMTPEKEIFGALGEERIHIAQFAQESSNFAQPQRKTFKDIQISGPFKVYIGDSDQASELFFVSRANGQQEILRYMLDHPWILLLLTLIITTPLLWWSLIPSSNRYQFTKSR